MIDWLAVRSRLIGRSGRPVHVERDPRGLSEGVMKHLFLGDTGNEITNYSMEICSLHVIFNLASPYELQNAMFMLIIIQRYYKVFA